MHWLELVFQIILDSCESPRGKCCEANLSSCCPHCGDSDLFPEIQQRFDQPGAGALAAALLRQIQVNHPGDPTQTAGVEFLCPDLQTELSLLRMPVEAPEHHDVLCGRGLK